ncbi:MAG: hypothetical protein J7J42_00960, partial [Thermoplasmata archaeon]|nr:hypothetical protein [Thermoplasmata archaeon]
IPLVLNSELAYELSQALRWKKGNEFEIGEMKEYYFLPQKEIIMPFSRVWENGHIFHSTYNELK